MAHVLGFLTVILFAILGIGMGHRYNINNKYYDGCEDVYSNFKWCESFIEGGYEVPYECCDGISKLNQKSKSGYYGGATRICQCIENIAASSSASHPFSQSHIRDLYYRCSIDLSFPISEHMDCSRINY